MLSRRGKQQEKYPTHVGMKEFYNYYAGLYFKETKPGNKKPSINYDSIYFIDYNTYSKIVSEFNLVVRDMILYENFEFKIPSSLGTISITKNKPILSVDKDNNVINNLPIDWGETWKLWQENEKARAAKKVVRHRNQHTNGFVCKVTYDKRVANYRNKSAYSFMGTRTLKVMTSQALKSDMELDFFEHK